MGSVGTETIERLGWEPRGHGTGCLVSPGKADRILNSDTGPEVKGRAIFKRFYRKNWQGAVMEWMWRLRNKKLKDGHSASREQAGG